jgi:hypothetical protein
MKAHEWLRRGSLAEDSFDALSNYWRAFNNLFAGDGPERQLISAFLRARIDEDVARTLLDSHSGEATVLMSQPVIDMRGNGRDTSPHMERFREAATSIDRLEALFMVIYQVRCNFEHGQKSPSRERDKALCKAACPFVAGVVDHAT